MWPDFMPIPLTEKCSAKLEALLVANAQALRLDPKTLICLPRSPYGSFGGFEYQTDTPGAAFEISISHEVGDTFAVHLTILNCSYAQGADFVRFANSFSFNSLVPNVKKFIETALSEGQ